MTVQLARSASAQDISREYTVAPDGVIHLSRFGAVHLAGKTVTEARLAIQDHLAQYFDSPLVGVSVVGYNSKTYYVITAGALTGESIQRFPITGNETVLDAIGQLREVPRVSSKTMWIARPVPGGCEQEQILPVDWNAIAAGGETKTNYQILPGDRLYIVDDSLVATNNYLRFLHQPHQPAAEHEPVRHQHDEKRADSRALLQPDSPALKVAGGTGTSTSTSANCFSFS